MFSRTFKEVAEWYLKNMGKLGLSRSDQHVKRAAAKALIKAFGNKVLSHGQIRARERLDRMSIREWKIQMESQGMSHGTLQRYLSAGSTFIKTAWDERDWDLPNPFEGATRKLRPNKRDRVLTDEERAALLLALPQPWRDVCQFILETAMRDGEVLHLEWRRIEDGFVWFDEGEETRNGGSKSRRRDSVPLTEGAKAIISRQPKLSPFVFTYHGGRMRYQTFWKAFNLARIRANVPHCTPHDLRRTVGYSLRSQGVSLDAIQAFLRHSSRSTTEQVYANVNPGMAQDAVKVLNIGVST